MIGLSNSLEREFLRPKFDSGFVGSGREPQLHQLRTEDAERSSLG